MRNANRLLLCALLASLVKLSLCPAQAAPASRPSSRPAGPEVLKLTLQPMPATRPVLAHKLLPDVFDQTPGNAATLYMIAARRTPDRKTAKDLYEKFDYFEADAPIEQLRDREKEVRAL